MASSSNEATSSNSLRWKYDVFLSFRGEDTRYGFTDHLYTSLSQAGIVTFRDNNDLERGKAISAQLVRAIEESMFSIIVLSKNYASSTWCLDELVKILECMKQLGQRVWPVFYHVDPSEVRKQKGEFGHAFARHEDRLQDNLEKVRKWREALTEVANLSGSSMEDGYESEFICGIVRYVSSEVKRTRQSPKYLVGIETRFAELSSYLQLEMNDVRMIGISGMGGLGKTTIAEETYFRLSSHFEGSSFVGKVRERSQNSGLASIQTQILCDTLKDQGIKVHDDHNGAHQLQSCLQCKRVLLVLDDVDRSEQLEKLAGSSDWFGPGSRIIIVSRDGHLLSSHGASKIYKGKQLNDEEASNLFVLKAFSGSYPENAEGYKKLSACVIKFASGLPLAVDVIGKHLFGRSEDVWKDAIDRMEKNPGKDILGILRISFDGLEESEKNIFLDIAFFLKSKEVDLAEEILDSFGFNSRIGLRVLEDKSLINISNNRIHMHDLIQKMGWDIVREECPREPGKRSRLRDHEDVDQVLSNNKGTNKIEVINLPCSTTRREFLVSAQAFAEMEGLRFLSVESSVHFPNGLDYLPNELRFMRLANYPLKSFPSSFQPRRLLELHLHRSSIQVLFPGVGSLEELRFIDLSSSKKLVKIPNLESLPNLEELILDGCRNLSEICSSVLVHNCLTTMDLTDCKRLKGVATKMRLESLISLTFSGCSMLKKFPEVAGAMEKLTTLSLDWTAIRELPPSMSCLTGLKFMDLSFCRKLVKVNLGLFPNLETLNLEGCMNLEEISPSILEHRRLVTLNLTKCVRLRDLATKMKLESLTSLTLGGCSELKKLPEIIGNMEKLTRLSLPRTAIRELPPGMDHLTGLKFLNLAFCENLVCLPPSVCNLQSLGYLLLVGCKKLEKLPDDIGKLRHLESLDLQWTSISVLPPSIGYLQNLKRSSLTGGDITTLPESIIHLPKLQALELENCMKLVSLPKLPSGLTRIEAANCCSLKELPNPLFDCTSDILRLDFLNCFKIAKRPTHGRSLESTILKEYILSNAKEGFFEITLPRKRLPKWVQHQSMGNSVTAEIPPDFHTSAIKGIVVAVVFGNLGQEGILQATRIQSGHSYPYSRCLPRLHLHLSNRDGNEKFKLMSVEGYPGIPLIKSDHLWMYCRFMDLNRCTSLEVELAGLSTVGVKMCGVHPIYGKDTDGVLQLLDQPGNEDDDDDDDNVVEPYPIPWWRRLRRVVHI